MLSSQLFWRMFSICSVLGIVMSMATGWQIAGSIHSTFLKHEQRQLEAAADGLRSYVVVEEKNAALPLDFTADQVRQLNRDFSHSTFQAGVVNSQGHLLWSRGSLDESILGRIKGLIEQSRSQGRAFAVQYLTNTDAVLVETIYRQGEAVGCAIVINPKCEALLESASISRRVWLSSALLTLAAIVVTYFVLQPIVRPLEELTLAAQRMADGGETIVPQMSGINEFGTLSSAIHSMSQQLNSRFNAMQSQQRELEQSYVQLGTVLAALVEGVIAIDDKERVVFANNAAIKQLELTPTRLLGRPIWEVVRHPQLQRVVSQTLALDEQPRLLIENLRTNTIVEMACSRLPGDPTPGAVLVFHDVTKLRQLEELRNSFVSNVQHELKTPLAVIMSNAETLLDGGMEDAEFLPVAVGRILKQAERLLQLIVDLLELSKAEAGVPQEQILLVDVAPIFRASIDSHRSVAESKGLELILGDAPGPLYVVAEERGVRTILDNLLDNAINYTRSGSVKVQWHEEEFDVVLEVIDTGPGIAAEHQTAIFERFYRIDKARSRDTGGTGLGLAIVKHLCQVFQGEVAVSSQLGSGSRFTVRLPKATDIVERIGDEPAASIRAIHADS